MKANECDFLDLLQGHKINFVIPVYQRNYDWKKEQCERLLKDLISLYENNISSHFFGSVVRMYSDMSNYLIIDGQQRITSVSLLLLAMYNFIENTNPSCELLKEEIYETYLINKFGSADRKIRLKPIKDDNEAYVKLFDNNSAEFIKESQMTTNYNYFYGELLKGYIDIDKLHNSLEKLEVVNIELSKEDDPQLIFEGLNSTGLALTEADKIRNFVLMGKNISSEKQEIYYYDYWNKMEKNVNFQTSDFIRDYLTYKYSKNIIHKNLYNDFKKYILNFEDTEVLLKDMLEHSVYYSYILNYNSPNESINQSLRDISDLDVIVIKPYYLELFSLSKEGIISEDDMVEILKILESFILRRSVCSLSNKSFNKLFATLGKEIKKYSDYKDNYLDVFKYMFTRKDTSFSFPSNVEFVNSLKVKDIYGTKIKRYMLEKIENYNNKEIVQIDSSTIEHIMPQTLTEEWITALGENYNDVHSQYVHTLGNLTITAYNPELSNKSFEEKRDMDGGFKSSRYKLNKYLAELDKWDKDEIEKRLDVLSKECLDIWAYPSTTFIPKILIQKTFTLSDEEDFSNKKVESFSILGEEHQSSGAGWNPMLKEICLSLYSLDEARFRRSLDKASSLNMVTVSKDTGSMPKEYIKIADDIFIHKKDNLSTVEKLVAFLKYIVSECGMDLEDIEFSFK